MKKPILVLSIAVVTAACSSNTGGSSTRTRSVTVTP